MKYVSIVPHCKRECIGLPTDFSIANSTNWPSSFHPSRFFFWMTSLRNYSVDSYHNTSLQNWNEENECIVLCGRYFVFAVFFLFSFYSSNLSLVLFFIFLCYPLPVFFCLFLLNLSVPICFTITHVFFVAFTSLKLMCSVFGEVCLHLFVDTLLSFLQTSFPSLIRAQTHWGVLPALSQQHFNKLFPNPLVNRAP